MAKEGDEGAVAVVEQMSTYLGKAMASIATVVNPQAFIIGGGVSKAGQYLIDAIADVYVNMLSQLVEKMSYNPAQILNLPCGTLQKGHPADVIIADIKNPYTITKRTLFQRQKHPNIDGCKREKVKKGNIPLYN